LYQLRQSNRWCKNYFRRASEKKRRSNASRAGDKERTCSDPKFVSATFDLQSVLEIPSSDVSAPYYSRKLCAYNLTVYEAAPPNKAFCFAWTGNNGQWGSCEIGTALLQWFKTLPQNVEEVSFIFWHVADKIVISTLLRCLCLFRKFSTLK
jgi:hypothetical protein